MKYDRRDVMRRAHALRRSNDLTMSEAMKAAWAQVKQPQALPAIQRRPPLEMLAQDIIALPQRAKALVAKVKDARIEFAFRVKAEVGVRVTLRDDPSMAFVKAGEIGAIYERRNGAARMSA